MRPLLLKSVATLIALSWSNLAAAGPPTHTIYNNSNVTMVADFIAMGCFKVSAEGNPLTCHTANIPAGGFARYTFPDATTMHNTKLDCQNVLKGLDSSRTVKDNCKFYTAPKRGSLVRGGETMQSHDYIIGQGWNVFSALYAADNGHMFATHNNGSLYWYHNIKSTGSTKQMWQGGGGKKIKSAWKATYPTTFGGHNGVLYAINTKGQLNRWDYARDGSPLGAGVVLGTGWHTFKFVFGGENGVIYAVKANGDMYRYKNIAKTGSTKQMWEGGGGKRIKQSPSTCTQGAAKPSVCLNKLAHMFGGANGAVYGVATDGKLYKYTATATVMSSGKVVGSDYRRYSKVFGGWGGRIYGVAK